MNIRDAVETDPAIVATYNAAIPSTATADLEPVSVESRLLVS